MVARSVGRSWHGFADSSTCCALSAHHYVHIDGLANQPRQDHESVEISQVQFSRADCDAKTTPLQYTIVRYVSVRGDAHCGRGIMKPSSPSNVAIPLVDSSDPLEAAPAVDGVELSGE